MATRAWRRASAAWSNPAPGSPASSCSRAGRTALVYPTLLAAVSDVAHPDWRASALGIYRLWRDSGYAVGAIAAGLLADAFTVPVAITAIGALTLVSGVVVAGVMYETLPERLRARVS